ncbi:MAG: ATP-dependent Clp protease adaptor ClpS [Planctomycetes bacterium]|nr:ATP-dependent Clp protease adaptor ClpS [Planctomycetota bacterium]
MSGDKPTSKQPRDDTDQSDTETATVIAPGWAVVFHDDPETPEDFILHAAMRHLGLDIDAARAVAAALGREGRAVAAKFPKSVAQQRAEGILAAARPKYPLRVTVEPVEP